MVNSQDNAKDGENIKQENRVNFVLLLFIEKIVTIVKSQ